MNKNIFVIGSRMICNNTFANLLKPKRKTFVFPVWDWLREGFFSAYLWVSVREETKTDSRRVYDSLGLIDTLGHDSTKGRFTFSYNDELTSHHGFILGKVKVFVSGYDYRNVYVIIS